MKIMLVILGILVAVLIIVVVVGALLPQNHVAGGSARYKQRPEIIFQTISDYHAYPSWRTDVQSIEPFPAAEGRVAWKEHSRHGDIPIEILESQPPSRLVTRIADPKLPFGGTWTYDIAPLDSGAGSMVTITENGEVYNPMFRFISRFVMGHSATIEQYLRALGRKFGEDVVPQPSP
jgi:uncharacterized protein YndB with AHSA1/START domain